MSSPNDPPSGSPRRAGQAFYVDPPGGPGRPVLVLHSWWGLNDGVRDWCRWLAGHGFTVMAPDLMNGLRPETSAEAELELGRLSADELASLVVSSASALRRHTSSETIGVVGFSMGGSLALWLATRRASWVDACAVVEATQDIDFDPLTARLLAHYATDGSLVTVDERVEMEAHLRLLEKRLDVVVHPGTVGWFADPGAPDVAAVGAEAVWAETADFLRRSDSTAPDEGASYQS